DSGRFDGASGSSVSGRLIPVSNYWRSWVKFTFLRLVGPEASWGGIYAVRQIQLRALSLVFRFFYAVNLLFSIQIYGKLLHTHLSESTVKPLFSSVYNAFAPANRSIFILSLTGKNFAWRFLHFTTYPSESGYVIRLGLARKYFCEMFLERSSSAFVIQ